MPGNESISSGMRGAYQRRMLEIRGAFEAGGASGAVTIAARAAAVDELVTELVGADGGAGPAAGEGCSAGGGGWVWAAGAVSLLGCGSAFFAGWEAGGEGREGRDPAGESGDVGLRDAGVSDDAEAGGVRTLRSGECGVGAGADGSSDAGGGCGSVREADGAVCAEAAAAGTQDA